MPHYHGRALTASGEEVSFTQEAASRDELASALRDRGLIAVRIAARAGRERGMGRQIPRRAVIDLTDTLSLLLTSGLSLKDALAITLTIFRAGPVHRAASTLLDRIRKGSSLFQALESYELSFPPIYRGLVRIGEKIGSLENVFARLSAYLKETRRFRERMVNALLYPGLILVFALIGVGLLGFFIIPKIEEIYARVGLGAPQEMAARMVLLKRMFWVIGAGISAAAAAAVGLRLAYRRLPRFAALWDRSRLEIPLLGRMGLYRDLLTFLFAMETLTESGYPVEDALDEAAAALSNRALRASIREIEARVRRGVMLSQAFREHPVFPERIGQWMLIGERSGQVETVFRQLRFYYQEEVDKWSTRLMVLAEPVFMILVGVVIVAFVFVFVLPIFSIYQGVI